ALLASGQSSTITGTLAGQIVMEGFVHIRLRPWQRRLLTRSIAIIPAVIVILWQGDAGVDPLLVLSQVILSLQLSFAVVPLIHFTSDRRKMGEFATPIWLRVLAWLSAAIIVSLNLKFIVETIIKGVNEHNAAVQFLLLPVSLVLVPLLAWMVIEPYWGRWRANSREAVPTPVLPPAGTTLAWQYRRIGVALEASPRDQQILAGVLPLARAAGTHIVLIHIVESATARFLGANVNDAEAREDRDYLERVSGELRAGGLECSIRIGAGEPENEIARIAADEKLD